MAITKKTSASHPSKSSLKLTKNQKIAVVVAVIVGIILYFYKGFFVAATINGVPITRWSIISQLEKTAGKQTLDSLVTKELVLQEANKRKIVVSDQEINQEMSKIEENVKRQGGNFEELLKAQGMNREDLKDQVKLQKLVDKMFTNQIKVSEQEVDQFMTENQESLPETTDEAALRVSITQQLRQQKLSQRIQELIDNLKKAAKINYFITY